MILEYSSLVFGLATEFCRTMKNLQLLKTEYKTKNQNKHVSKTKKTLFNIQPMLTTVQKSHTKNLENSRQSP